MTNTQSLIKKLKALPPLHSRTVVGFDGYVDYIQKAVKGTGANGRAYFEKLPDFGTHIVAAAGKSAQVEMRTQTIKLGGNAPIFAQALATLGVQNSLVGMMGHPTLHPVFTQLHENCDLISIGAPAVTCAIEFDDGKLLLSEVTSFDPLDWSYIERSSQHTAILNAMRNAQLIAMVDWANLPRCTELWQGIERVARQEKWTDKIFFFDLCDPSRKSTAEIQDAINTISSFSSIGRTYLGMNENEALKTYSALANKIPSAENLCDIAKTLFKKMTVNTLVIHPVDRCIIADQNQVSELKGRVVTQPAILTGGGDNLNAGFCFGLMHGLADDECALIGVAASGAYVQNGSSPTLPVLLDYLKTL